MRARAMIGSRIQLPRRLRALILIALVAMLAAACGVQAGGGETAEEGGSEAAEEGGTEGSGASEQLASCLDSDEPVELLVWGSRDYYLPPDRFEAFQEQYPHITINWDVQANDDILQQMQRMQAAGQKMPDIVHDDTFRVAEFEEAGLIRPIEDVMAQWQEEAPEQYDAIMPLAWEENEIDGQTWGMAIMANFDIVYYNVPWFEEAGVSPPFETFEDLYAAMTQMKEARPDSIPLTVQALEGEGVTTFLTTASAAGVEFDGAVPVLTSENGVYILDFFIRAATDGLLPPEAISWGESEARGAFIRGDAGMILDGITTAGDFNSVGDFNFEEDWATTLLPKETETGLSGDWITSARTWMLSSDTEHPCEAGLVLRHLAEPEVLLDTLEGGAVPMRHTEALEQAGDVLPLFTDELKEGFLEAGTVPAGPNAGEIENILEQMWGEIVTGKATDAQALADKYQPQLDPLKP
jgi:ABC-type glycerol-3-phosphate transport system substrate-binding protein